MNSLIAGAMAGGICDVFLHPVDTFKTRLQSSSGPRTMSVFRGMYNGIGAVILSSAPSSAAFFYCYERIKETNVFPQSGFGYAAAAGHRSRSSATWAHSGLHFKKPDSGSAALAASGLMFLLETALANPKFRFAEH
jgi:hypothetical protein